MKLFTTSQIRELDHQTIELEPISSIELMERASDRLLQQFRRDWSLSHNVLLLAGPGNNGGDGLALARMLLQLGYDVQVLLIAAGKLAPNCQTNRERLLDLFPDFICQQSHAFTPPEITPHTIIIDALFGSGTSRPLAGIYRVAVKWINSQKNKVVAIDIPSGLEGEKCADSSDTIVKANFTYTLQFPKLAFFFPENEEFVGKWKLIDIQLHPKAMAATESPYCFLKKEILQSIVKTRSHFSHKGTFGHTLVWAGKTGMAGAAVLATKAALRTGTGLVSIHSVEENRVILQTAIPEALFINKLHSLEGYNAIAFGPGLGTERDTAEMLFKVLKTLSFPSVIDADALNILSQNPNYLHFIPQNSILTPHPKEFDRLFGDSSNSQKRMEMASRKAQELRLIIVLKGANTLIALPNGKLYFNSTGNPGMAVGGMGDVLAGMIAGLLAQKYTPEESALLGVYLHGLASDLVLDKQSEESLLPSDVIENIGQSFIFLMK